jgi:hypothetical protein
LDDSPKNFLNKGTLMSGKPQPPKDGVGPPIGGPKPNQVRWGNTPIPESEREIPIPKGDSPFKVVGVDISTSSTSTNRGFNNPGRTIVQPLSDKGIAIAIPKTDPPHDSEDYGIDEDFVIAAKVEALLKGLSNRRTLKVLNMVGSVHGIRSISVDRPIGQPSKNPIRQSSVGSSKRKGKSGNIQIPTLKKDPRYIELSSQRDAAVAALKRDGPDGNTHLDHLRSIEQQLKDLKTQSRSGNQ